jgi:hypothetical protein
MMELGTVHAWPNKTVCGGEIRDLRPSGIALVFVGKGWPCDKDAEGISDVGGFEINGPRNGPPPDLSPVLIRL